ncbi:2-dehydro-3-deoxygalactonokinase [Granulosicoccus sp. 3-233]|uniref:2-dehydro-3-deoxygalactonokinase n=1 Tax=Granulosicoccus sp. 3-233 TaxID=3417969 RepID=UPI003D34C010
MSSVASDPALIGLDWGTSSFRAHLLDREGLVLDCRSSDKGIMQIRDCDFEAELHRQVAVWAKWRDLPIVASGMIGSRNGWMETPYIEAPAQVDTLAGALTTRTTSQGYRVHLVPGVKAEHGGAPDVMRGEETQILGAVDTGMNENLFVLPGTHSKWIRVNKGCIEGFSTFMTGEMFSLLRSHSVLGKLMDDEDASFSKKGFLSGVNAGLEAGQDLLHRLFRVRTLPLFDIIDKSMVSDYLSGLLIGAEIASPLARGRETCTGVAVMCRDDLAQRYEVALGVAGIPCTRVPDNVVSRGHIAIARAAGLIP